MATTTHDVDLMDLDAFVAGREHELFARLRDEAPLHFNEEPGGRGFWSFTRYEDVKWAAGDPQRFSSAGGTQIQDRRAEGSGTPSMHNMDAPRHKELRRIVVDRFTRKGVEAHTLRRAHDVVDRLLDRALEHGEGDLVGLVSEQLPLQVFGTWLGVPAEDLHHVVRWVNVLGGQEDPEYVADADEVERSRQELFAYFSALTEERRARPQDDLVSALVHARPGGEALRIDELLPYYVLLMFAGNDTTRNLVSWGAIDLHEHPHERAALDGASDGELGLLIEEMLRLASPIYCMRRTATEDVERHGRTIRAGEKVVLWFAAANRDPRVFDDPEGFDGRRTPNKHLAFGWGSHFCLGSHLARMETEVLLRRIAARGIRIEVTGEPDRLRSNFVRGIKRLPVRFHA
jgi:cytochrome P450